MTIAAQIEIPDQVLADLCRRYQVKSLHVFGSAARNELRPDSDIDLLVELQPGHTLGLFEFWDLEEELASLLGRKVDLVAKGGLNRHRAPQILRDARLLYEN